MLTLRVFWQAVVFELLGAAGGDRTHDPWLRRPILYPLSYSRFEVQDPFLNYGMWVS